MIGEQMQPVVPSLQLEHLVDEVIPLIALQSAEIYMDPLIIPEIHKPSPPCRFTNADEKMENPARRPRGVFQQGARKTFGMPLPPGLVGFSFLIPLVIPAPYK
jgi:hypothetical protein